MTASRSSGLPNGTIRFTEVDLLTQILSGVSVTGVWHQAAQYTLAVPHSFSHRSAELTVGYPFLPGHLAVAEIVFGDNRLTQSQLDADLDRLSPSPSSPDGGE